MKQRYKELSPVPDVNELFEVRGVFTLHALQSWISFLEDIENIEDQRNITGPDGKPYESTSHSSKARGYNRVEYGLSVTIREPEGPFVKTILRGRTRQDKQRGVLTSEPYDIDIDPNVLMWRQNSACALDLTAQIKNPGSPLQAQGIASIEGREPITPQQANEHVLYLARLILDKP